MGLNEREDEAAAKAHEHEPNVEYKKTTSGEFTSRGN